MSFEGVITVSKGGRWPLLITLPILRDGDFSALNPLQIHLLRMSGEIGFYFHRFTLLFKMNHYLIRIKSAGTFSNR
jgi:hypothetical protein